MADLENVNSTDIAVNQLQDAVDNMRQQLESATSAAQSTADSKTDDTYEAADAADWSGSAPGSIKEALDRLAAAVGPVA
jgi:hypothetical protein